MVRPLPSPPSFLHTNNSLTEWIMGIAAKEGYVGSNSRAMQLWEESYPSGALSVALTDTFTTKPFFDDFVADPVRANRWKGLSFAFSFLFWGGRG